MRRLNCFVVICLYGLTLGADELPPGVVNTQQASDLSLSPQESLARITVRTDFGSRCLPANPTLDGRSLLMLMIEDDCGWWKTTHTPSGKPTAPAIASSFSRDSNHDGQFDQRTVFWDKGRYLTGLAVGHGGVWIANTPELSFLPDRNQDDVPDSEPIVMLDGFQKSSKQRCQQFSLGTRRLVVRSHRPVLEITGRQAGNSGRAPDQHHPRHLAVPSCRPHL